MKKQPQPLIDDNGEVRELTDADFVGASRGRPPMPEEQKKERVTMYLDKEILLHFREGGKGWQTRVNEKLREVLK